MSIIVKSMSLEHLDDIMILENLCFKIPWSKNSFIQELTQNNSAIYLVAVDTERAVGYGGMWKVLDEGQITNIAVHPEYQRKGIGSSILEEMINAAKDSKIQNMTLEVRESNRAAKALYKKFGFVEEGIRKAYYADNGENAIIMWKNQI